MRGFIGSDFVWRFAGGFALGALGLVMLQPAAARDALTARVATIAHLG